MRDPVDDDDDNDSQKSSKSSRNAALVALALVNLVDAISYMVVAPSLIFYVQACGGSKEQYGMILSAFSFASFCAKPVLGHWTDASGNKFRVPYLTSILVASAGGLLYFYASVYSNTSPEMAIGLILAGRLLGGIGAANSALGFAYLATAIPPEEQTQVNSLLSMTRIIGMAAGPGFNLLLQNIHATWMQFTLDPLNSVGLFLVVSNLLGFVSIFFFLSEPPPKAKQFGAGNNDDEYIEGSKTDFFKDVFSLEILLPIYTIFVVNSNFQLIETALAPAAYHAMGWGPVKTSGVLGSTSVLLFLVMMLVFYLAKKQTKDETLVVIGNLFWIVGGLSIYYLWSAGAEPWHFVVPVMICVTGFPFIGASNRSLFTKRVDSKPSLETRHAFMQAVLSMAASVAGFVTPGFVAKYVLRQPEEVDASPDHRELNPLALYTVFCPMLTIVGLFYINTFKKLDTQEISDNAGAAPNADMEAIGETSPLVNRLSTAQARRSSTMVLEQKVDPTTVANRRISCQMMGVSQFDTPSECKRRSIICAELAAEFCEDL